MAFCEKCGKQLEDGATCTCQTVNVQPAASGNTEVAKAKDKKKKNPLIIAIPAAVVLVIILVAIFGSKAYMGPLKDYMKLFNERSTDVMAMQKAMMPDFRSKSYEKLMNASVKADYFEDSLEDSKDYLEERYEYLDDEYEGWKISFETKKKEKLDKDDIEDYQDMYEDYYGDYVEDIVENYEDILDDDDDLEDFADDYDVSEKEAKAMIKAYIKYLKSWQKLKVTNGYEVKGKFVVKDEDDEYKSDTFTFKVLKINGDWDIIGISDGGIGSLDDAGSDFNTLLNRIFSNESYYFFY